MCKGPEVGVCLDGFMYVGKASVAREECEGERHRS